MFLSYFFCSALSISEGERTTFNYILFFLLDVDNAEATNIRSYEGVCLTYLQCFWFMKICMSAKGYVFFFDYELDLRVNVSSGQKLKFVIHRTILCVF